jgi:hypothetical protein
VALVDPGSSAADANASRRAPLASARAAAVVPPIGTRASWGADERLRSAAPRYTGQLQAGFVHHTVSANNYSAAAVPKMIRGIYAYHTRSNHWSDIGYNFLVDRFGRLWEGRAGGVTANVLGAHTGGFNSNSFAVSAIGDFSKVAAPPEMVDAIARLLAWKLSLNFRDPNGTTVLVSEGGGTSRYRAGTPVTFNVISGHRDAGNTQCPGTNLYAQLPTIRALATQYMGAGLVNPAPSTAQPVYGGAPLTVSAGALQPQSWTFEVRDHVDGRLVATQSGSAAPGAPVAASWDLRDQSGAPVRPGAFDLTLLSTGAVDGAQTWVRPVTVIPPVADPPTAPAAALPPASGFVPLDPARIYDSTATGQLPLGPRRRVDVPVLGQGGVPVSGVGAVALSVTSSQPSTSTFLTVWPAGASRPTASSLNIAAGAARSALAVTALGGNGLVSVYNGGGTTELAVDVVGYYPTARDAAGAVTGQTLHPVAPFRLFDSRRDPAGRVEAGTSRTLTMRTLGGVTPDQMGAVVLNVTAVDGTGTGSLTVHRPGSGIGAATSLYYGARSPVATRVVTSLSDGGKLRIDNRGAAASVVVDVMGWYAPTSIAGGKAFQAIAPRRMLDTRAGLGARRASVGARKTLALTVRAKGKLPASATAVVLNLTATGATGTTWLTAWPAGVRRPLASDLNVLPGRDTANLVVVKIGTKGRVNLYNAAGSTNLVADVVGYYR